MPRPDPMPRAFYDRDVVEVARELLGARLVSRAGGRLAAGIVVETEAYLAEGDPACHAFRGPTPRNRSMFGEPGHAYVYRIHQVHCLNAVSEGVGRGAAVLIRAVEPTHGLDVMSERRGASRPRDLARGPGRLCQALGLDRRHDGLDLTAGRILWIEDGPRRGRLEYAATPRIGIRLAAELPLRFLATGSRHVSGPRRGPSDARSRGAT